MFLYPYPRLVCFACFLSLQTLTRTRLRAIGWIDQPELSVTMTQRAPIFFYTCTRAPNTLPLSLSLSHTHSFTHSLTHSLTLSLRLSFDPVSCRSLPRVFFKLHPSSARFLPDEVPPPGVLLWCYASALRWRSLRACASSVSSSSRQPPHRRSRDAPHHSLFTSTCSTCAPPLLCDVLCSSSVSDSALYSCGASGLGARM